MEVARVFLEKLVQAHDPANPELDEAKINRHIKVMRTLGHVMLRLGDANSFRENFDSSLQDYEKCLDLRKFTEDSFFSRDLSEMYTLKSL